jgi:hypothetical protein
VPEGISGDTGIGIWIKNAGRVSFEKETLPVPYHGNFIIGSIMLFIK